MTIPIRQNKHLHGIATLKIFTPSECTNIIKIALNNWTEEEGTISNFKDLNWRNTTLFFPSEAAKKSDWFKKISDNIMSFNKDSYGFDISGMVEPPCMMRYMAPDINPNKKAGKYDWHMDIGPSSISCTRKLSYSILLNVGKYKGGELEFHLGRGDEVPDSEMNILSSRPNQTGADALGSMILFPSYFVHRVLPVTKGTRYAIVGWMNGNSFR